MNQLKRKLGSDEMKLQELPMPLVSKRMVLACPLLQWIFQPKIFITIPQYVLCIDEDRTSIIAGYKLIARTTKYYTAIFIIKNILGLYD